MRALLLSLLLACSLLFGTSVQADEYTSANYRVLDPVLQPAEYSTSAGFRLWSTIA